MLKPVKTVQLRVRKSLDVCLKISLKLSYVMPSEVHNQIMQLDKFGFAHG